MHSPLCTTLYIGILVRSGARKEKPLEIDRRRAANYHQLKPNPVAVVISKEVESARTSQRSAAVGYKSGQLVRDGFHSIGRTGAVKFPGKFCEDLKD